MTSSWPASRPVWVDGTIVASGEARVSVLSHAMQRGSLVFDVGAIRETAGGGVACFRARDHIDRFLRSAALVGLDVRWDRQTLLAATSRTARETTVRSGLVRWSAFVPSIENDLLPRATSRACVVIAVILASDAPTTAAARSERDPPRPTALHVGIPRDMRKAGPEVFPPQAKVAASYLGPMLAKRRARAYGYDDVVLLDREGRVAEAPTANVFAVIDGVLVTPPTDRVLAGITRASLLDLARADSIAVREAHFTPQDLATADEAFLCATSLPLEPIASVDGQSMRAEAPGPVTRHLRTALAACERGEDARFAHWLDPVT